VRLDPLKPLAQTASHESSRLTRSPKNPGGPAPRRHSAFAEPDFSAGQSFTTGCWTSLGVLRTGDASPIRVDGSIVGGPLDVIDDEDFDGTFGRFESQPKLIL
jgi:hypothetical protein